MKKRVVFTSIIIALVVMALSCIFFALPGQFAAINGTGFINSNDLPVYNGYEILFNCKDVGGINYLHENVGGRVSAVIFIIIFLMVATIPLLVFYKKDPAFVILGGALTTINGFIFLMMKIWLTIIYPKKAITMSWTSYVSGAFLLIIGVWLIVLGSLEISKAQAEAIQKKAQSYNYLKNK